MSSDSWLTLISSFLEASGIIIFFKFYISGLKKKIESLEETTNAKNETIETLQKSISDVDNLKNTWKSFVSDMPLAMKDFKNTYEQIIAAKERYINTIENSRDVKEYVSFKRKSIHQSSNIEKN